MKRKFPTILPEQILKISSAQQFMMQDNSQLLPEKLLLRMSKIHHRQPVIISKSQINNYFNLNNNAVEFLKTVKPPELKYHEISTKINNPSANDATLINPVTK